mgnify:CR=1 FL=1
MNDRRILLHQGYHTSTSCTSRFVLPNFMPRKGYCSIVIVCCILGTVVKALVVVAAVRVLYRLYVKSSFHLTYVGIISLQNSFQTFTPKVHSTILTSIQFRVGVSVHFYSLLAARLALMARYFSRKTNDITLESKSTHNEI